MVVQKLQKLINIFDKQYLKKLITTLLLINSTPAMANLIITPIFIKLKYGRLAKIMDGNKYNKTIKVFIFILFLALFQAFAKLFFSHLTFF